MLSVLNILSKATGLVETEFHVEPLKIDVLLWKLKSY